MKFRFAFLIVVVAGVCAGHDVITTKITWTREVSRLVYKSCVSCHREGGSSFSLVNYAEARPWAKAIKEEVLARRMPPWNAVKGFGELANDKGLTQEQIEVIAGWVEGGAPEGNPAYLPKAPSLASESVRRGGSKVSLNDTLRLTAPVTVSGILPGPLPKGGALLVVAALPNGVIEPLIWVQAFNPSYNRPYWFKKPLTFPAGTVIRTSPAGGTASLLTETARPASRQQRPGQSYR